MYNIIYEIYYITAGGKNVTSYDLKYFYCYYWNSMFSKFWKIRVWSLKRSLRKIKTLQLIIVLFHNY